MDSIEYEALRRANQMQQSNSSRKAQPAQNRKNSHPTEQISKKTESENLSESHNPVSKQPAESFQKDHSLLSTLFEDKEKLLILALILILSAEESQDPSLTLALLYLII